MTREEAAKQLSEWKEVITIPSRKEAIDMAIKALEQEPSNGDLIWRNDAIDALAYFDEKSPTGKTAQDIIVGLPSAQPELCENAVSRQRLLSDLKELIAAWKKYPVMAEQIKGVETAIGYVEVIPSVKPDSNMFFCAGAERRTDEGD